MQLTKNDQWIGKKIKNFREGSVPVFSSEFIQGISLKKLFNIESNDDKPITLIAVTRNQLNNRNFSKYERYIRQELGFQRIYYGLWFDGERTEHDVLYAIPTDDDWSIQEHLNSHNHVNQGVAQIMALVVSSGGKIKTVRNYRLVNAF